MKKYIKNAGWILASLLAVWAPGMDMNIQRKLRPDAFELGGYLYQSIGRTFRSIQTDSITLLLAALAVLWIVRRYLYHKPRNTGVGEYFLCGFFSVMQLLNTAVNQTGSVQTLYENMFQLIKVFMYLIGMFVLFLCGVRALNELLGRKNGIERCRLWDKHPFWFPFVVLTIAWLPHLIIKFPGSLTIDTALQYHQFVGIDPRTTPHPPFGTIVYGLLISTALKSPNPNLYYFAFTLIKTLLFIAELSYALSVMNRYKVPQWVGIFAFILFAVSPIYVGWTTAISKDSSYLLLCMLVGTMMLENLADGQLDRKPRRLILLAVSLILMMLIRHNGVLLAFSLLTVMCFSLLKTGKKRFFRFVAFGCAVMVGFFGIRTLIYETMGFEKRKQDDWMSLMFQQTGRVVSLHDEEIPQEEKEILNKVFVYDEIKERYSPDGADKMRWNFPEDGRVNGEIPALPENNGRSDEELKDYIKVWWEQFKRYPMDYLDAVLEMNGILFDLQQNWPVYISLTNHVIEQDVYQDVYRDSFNDMNYYNPEQLAPLNGYQRALTEWYYHMHELPLVGNLFSMGFCVELMITMLYLGWTSGRKRMLCVWIPSLMTGVMGLFCAIVYLRYLLPLVGSVPLWFAAWHLCDHESNKDKIA